MKNNQFYIGFSVWNKLQDEIVVKHTERFAELGCNELFAIWTQSLIVDCEFHGFKLGVRFYHCNCDEEYTQE